LRHLQIFGRLTLAYSLLAPSAIAEPNEGKSASVVLAEDEEPAAAPNGKSVDPDDDDAPPAKRRPKDEDEDEPKAAREAGAASAGGAASTDAPLNWLSISFQQDLLSYKDTTGVCTGAAQYQCFLEGKSYGDPIYRGSGDQLGGGVGFATKRVLVGYERVLAENITLGAKLGFAFGGSPKATTGQGSAFVPFHAEVRGSYWFGKSPFATDGLRGYAGVAAGLMEIDGHVTVDFYQDAAGFNARSKGKLDAWRKTGNGFAGLHAGVAYGFSKQHQLFLELRVLQMLGATALGGALNIGYAYGL
jgi:hypothetical protein